MAADGWHDGEIEVQRRAGVTDHQRLRTGVRDALPPHFVSFLAAQRFLVLATHDAEGILWCSMAAGWPGFATARDPHMVAIDHRAVDDDIVRHLAVNSRIGLLAFDPSTRRRIRVNGSASVEAGALTVHIAETFGNCQQYIQKRPAAGPEPHGSRIASTGAGLEPRHRAWIARADTAFLASTHPSAGPDASHRGGRPGFVAVVDDRTLRFDDYDGNNMFQTLGNIAADPAAAMLFVDFETGSTLQLAGEATIIWSAQESPTGRAVQFAAHTVVERRSLAPWSWPVLEYSPLNP